jgi:membrane protease YdiL (CAAX protease family)
MGPHQPEPEQYPDSSPAPRRVTARELWVVAALAATAMATTIPVRETIITEILRHRGIVPPLTERTTATVFIPWLVLTALITFAMSATGLWLAAKIPMQPVRLLARRWPDADLGSRWATVRRSAALGVAFAGFSISVQLVNLAIFGHHAPAGTAPALESLRAENVRIMSKLASAGGASALILGAPISEELEFRLLVVPLLAWAIGRVSRAREGTGAPGAIWTAVVLSGFAFGLAHVLSVESVAWWSPWYLQILLDPRSYVGIALGWMFWRWGLESAIIAHVAWNVAAIGAAGLLVRLRI